MTTTIHGIKACDTMKRARAWLDARRIPYTFHDYRVQGVDREMLHRWAAAVGWQTLINRSGTTFRKLSETDRMGLDDAKAITLMLAQPTMIKRPVLDVDGTLIVGFSPETYAATFR